MRITVFYPIVFSLTILSRISQTVPYGSVPLLRICPDRRFYVSHPLGLSILFQAVPLRRFLPFQEFQHQKFQSAGQDLVILH